MVPGVKWRNLASGVGDVSGPPDAGQARAVTVLRGFRARTGRTRFEIYSQILLLAVWPDVRI